MGIKFNCLETQLLWRNRLDNQSQTRVLAIVFLRRLRRSYTSDAQKEGFELEGSKKEKEGYFLFKGWAMASCLEPAIRQEEGAFHMGKSFRRELRKGRNTTNRITLKGGSTQNREEDK